MRFFQEYNGFIWEFNSLGEFLKVVLVRILATIAAIGVLFLLLWLL